MEDSNLPRMIAEDRELFIKIIEDLFPGVIYNKVSNKEFVDAVSESLQERNIILNPVEIEKIN